MELLGSGHISNLKTSADFCKECGNLIDLPLDIDFIKCLRCGFECSILGK